MRMRAASLPPKAKSVKPSEENPAVAEARLAGQCERNPECTRGFRHAGKGGRCALLKAKRPPRRNAAEQARRAAAAPLDDADMEEALDQTFPEASLSPAAARSSCTCPPMRMERSILSSERQRAASKHQAKSSCAAASLSAPPPERRAAKCALAALAAVRKMSYDDDESGDDGVLADSALAHLSPIDGVHPEEEDGKDSENEHADATMDGEETNAIFGLGADADEVVGMDVAAEKGGGSDAGNRTDRPQVSTPLQELPSVAEVMRFIRFCHNSERPHLPPHPPPYPPPSPSPVLEVVQMVAKDVPGEAIIAAQAFAAKLVPFSKALAASSDDRADVASFGRAATVPSPLCPPPAPSATLQDEVSRNNPTLVVRERSGRPPQRVLKRKSPPVGSRKRLRAADGETSYGGSQPRKVSKPNGGNEARPRKKKQTKSKFIL